MMPEEDRTPGPVFNAMEVLNMYDEIYELRAEVKHYKEMYEMLRDAQTKQLENSQKFIVGVFTKLCEPIKIAPEDNIVIEL